MTLDEATRLLNAAQLMLIGENYQPISDLYYALQIAVNSIEELAERREADRWIPVRERLPEKDGKYIVDVGWKIDIDVFDTDGTEFIGGGNSVIAWKPLPKHYKSEATNEQD